MDIIRIDGCTRVVGESQGYLGLSLRDVTINCSVNGEATPAMESAWQPTPEEIAKIVAGERRRRDLVMRTSKQEEAPAIQK